MQPERQRRKDNKREIKIPKIKLPKTKYSKVIVALVIGLVAAFTIGALVVFYKVEKEPTALIAAFFGFCTGELWMLSGIKKRDQNSDQTIEQKDEIEEKENDD